MKSKDRILELLKLKPMLVRELQKELQLPTEGIFINAMSFLEKYKLVETMASTKHELMAKITPLGLQLLNLPDLPEDELASDQLEVLERHWGGEMDSALDREADLNLGQEDLKERDKVRFGDQVWRQESVPSGEELRTEQARDEEADREDYEKQVKEAVEEGEFSEATIRAIKAREAERQREIAGASK